MSATFTTMYKNFMLLYSTNSNICYWQNLLLDGIKKQKQTNKQANKGPNKQKTNGKNKKKQINKRTNKNKQISKQTKRKDTFRFHRRCRCCEVSAECVSQNQRLGLPLLASDSLYISRTDNANQCKEPCNHHSNQ